MNDFAYDVALVDIHTGPISIEDYFAAVKALKDGTPWRGHYIREIDDVAVGPDGGASTGFIRGIEKHSN